MTSTDPATGDLSRFAGTWILDPAKTTVTFRTTAMRVPPVKGTAKAISGDTQMIEVTGELTAGDRTQPLTLHAEVTGTGRTATVTTEAGIDRSLRGVSWATRGAGLKDQVAVRARFGRAGRSA